MAEFRQEVVFAAAPERVFAALSTSAGHSAFTGAPAEISSDEGGTWSAFGGAIRGRNLEIVPGKRLVQSWRSANWPEGAWSLVRFDVEGHEGGTKIVLHHLATPQGTESELKTGWQERYWGPLQAWLSA